MRYLLDTNVVSELRKGERMDDGVRRWWAEIDPQDPVLSVLVVGELRLGVNRLRQRNTDAAQHLAGWLDSLESVYRDRILDIDEEVTVHWADLNTARPLPVIDSLLGATALAHGLVLVTRDTSSLAETSVPLFDPFG